MHYYRLYYDIDNDYVLEYKIAIILSSQTILSRDLLIERGMYYV